MKTKTKPHRNTVDLASCMFSHLGEFRQDTTDENTSYLRHMGCLDAPHLLPAGATRRYLLIDTVHEEILAWPEAMTVPREPRK